MDSTEYEPGTVAIATVRGVEGVRVFRRYSPDTGVCDWAYNPDPARGLNYSCDSDSGNVVTDVRPLVVLDLEGVSDVRNLLSHLKAGSWWSVADQVEAQTKPPRIPEPGLWGVVEANVMGDQSPQADYHWVHLAHDQWEAIGSSQPPRRWNELIDPTLIREGLS